MPYADPGLTGTGPLMFLLLASVVSTAAAGDALTPREIMARATEAAGGDSWRHARTISLSGSATLYRGGRAVTADRYEMRRVFPRRLDDAHTTTGKFRLDAYAGEAVMFTIISDGEGLFDQNGPMAEEEARVLAASSFGFSAARFALDEGFDLARLADDQVEGFPCFFVRVTDPSGSETLFGIDQQDYTLRMVGWDTPRGWHHRIYSDFYWVDKPRFRQPGRVRLYYDGVKTADITWESAVVDVPLADTLFAPVPPAADQADSGR